MDILEFFPLVLYTLGSILLVILIILGIKLIKTVDKTNMILDDAYNKTRSLNGLFNAIDHVTDALSSINDSIVSAVSSTIGRLFYKDKKTKKGKKNEKESEEDE